MNKGLDLRPFARRVRTVRAWRGLAVGLMLGGFLGLVWAVLDATGVLFAEWTGLALLFGCSGALGAVVGSLLPVRESVVAKSVDRRAALRDRLGTSIERDGMHEGFDDAQREDTARQVEGLRAKSVYPVQLGRWQYTSFAVVCVASLVFLLGNTWYLLSPDARKAKEEMTKIAAQIERVAKPLVERKDLSEQERTLGNELREFARRLEKGRIPREEGMKRANELAKQAQKLAQDRTQRSLQKMQTAREQMTRAELASKGLDKATLDKLNLDQRQRQLLDQLQKELGIDPRKGDGKFGQEQMDQLGLQQMDSSLLNLTDEQRDMLSDLIQKELNDIERKLASGKGLTPEQLSVLLQRKDQLKDMQEQVEISEEALRALEEFMNSPEYKDIMKAVNKMRDAAQQVADGQPLTDEQIEQLEQMLDELDERLEGSKYQEMVMKQLRAALEMLKQGKAFNECQGACLNPFGLSLGVNPIRGFGSGGRSKDNFFAGYGGINKSKDEMKGEGETNLLGVRGQRRAEGEEWFVEVKAPSAMGDRTSVPYQQVLPKYKNAAEKAIERQDIPKEHEKRVREYFESLSGGKK